MCPSTEAIWGMRALQRGNTKYYVDWAVGLLEAGRDSKNLRILAGLESRDSVFEAEDYFLKVVKELSISEPSREDAILGYCVATAQQIISGEVEPRVGIKKLYQICCECNYPKNLMIWFELDDACDSLEYGDYPFTYPELSVGNLKEVALREARGFIERSTTCKEG